MQEKNVEERSLHFIRKEYEEKMKELDKELEYYREFRLKSIKESQKRRINGGGRVKQIIKIYNQSI